MSDFISIKVTSVEDLLQYQDIRLRSWKDDYLHRPDSPQGATTWDVAHDWRVSRGAGGTIMLRSWKSDYLQRPDSPHGVTTGSNGEWTVEFNGETVRLKSWKGDYLHRPDGPPSLTTWHTGIGNEWHVEVSAQMVASRASYGPFLDVLLKGDFVKLAGFFGQDGARLAASPDLVMSPSEVLHLVAGFQSNLGLRAEGIFCGGVKYMFLTEPAPGTIIARRGPTTFLAALTQRTVIVVLTDDGANPANVTSHTFIQEYLKKKGL